MTFLFIFRRYLLILDMKSLKKVSNYQKRLKTAEKSSLTSSRVACSTQKLLKYTTQMPPLLNCPTLKT